MWNGNVPLHQWIQHRTYSWNDGNWEMEQEHSGRLLWLFDERSFVPVAMIKEGKAYSIMTDHLGTPTQAYDSEGNEVWSRMLDMDGNVLEETGNIGMIPFLFQGQYFDCEIGLAYNRFRYYSPQMGIYVSQDPIRLAGGILNLYGYVYDTNSWLDIFGLKKKSKARKPKYQRIKSTGRTKIVDKNEAFVLDFVKKHPENGTVIIESALIGDKAFNGYSKMSQTINGVEIHYMAKFDKNKTITDVADFKIKTNKNIKYRSK